MRLWCALLLLCLAGCESEAVLVVSLRTDLVGGLEVDRAATVVDDGTMASTPLSAADDLIGGRRVAELSVAPGRRRVTVELSGPDGFVARRTLLVDVRGATAVTAVITRSCRGVTCPEASDAAATECLGGVCVPPECTPETPEFCPVAECEAPADCASGPMCTAPVCLGGACGLRADASACEGGVCDPDEGCVDAPPPDAGLPMDAGPGDAGLSDAGPVDAGPSDAGPSDAGPSDAGPSDAGRSVCAGVCPGTCEGELCVLNGAAGQQVCPSRGVDCEFRCTGFGSCDGPLTCGAGDCTVICNGPSSCSGDIRCGGAARCDVRCTNSSTCTGEILCGANRCGVECSRESSCTTVRCGPGRADVSCTAMATCGEVLCPSAARLDLVCTGFGACDDVSCGGAECAIDCSGTSCATVACAPACDCDVTCTGFSSCGTVTCPSGCASGRGCMSDGTPACGC